MKKRVAPAVIGLSQVAGHARPKETLRRVLESGSIHHAWLFTGPSGVGKETAARAFAKALLCERGAEESCNACPACVKFSSGCHTDFIQVLSYEEMFERGLLGKDDIPKDQTSGKGPSRGIRVAQIRELGRMLSLKPAEGKAKVALICDAEKMNVESQNCLLKTLEEPSSSTYLLLVTSSPSLLLPTVRSRCQKLSFNRLSQEDTVRLVMEISGCGRAEAEVCSRVSDGRPGAAMKVLDDERLMQRREDAAVVASLGDMKWSELLDAAQRLSGSFTRSRAFLEFLMTLLRDAAVLKIEGKGSGNVINLDMKEKIYGLAGILILDDLYTLSEKLHLLLADLERNVNLRLAVETFLIDMKKRIRREA